MKFLTQIIEFFQAGSTVSGVPTTLGSAFLIIGMSAKKFFAKDTSETKTKGNPILENDMWAIE